MIPSLVCAGPMCIDVEDVEVEPQRSAAAVLPGI
jgi:hypothetical protein